MARHFLRLKLRLIRNGLRGSAFRIVSFVVGALFAAQFALLGFLALALPSAGATRATIPIVAFVLVFLGWVVVPVFGFGLDETLDPDRLSLLPLSPRQLMVGLFVASATGVAPGATVLGLSGAIVGYAFFGPGTPLVVTAVVIEFALCLVAARAVTTAMSRWLRSRRARDLWIVALSLLGLLLNGIFQSLRFLGRTLPPGSGERLGDILRWLPPGMVGRAVVDADAGRLGLAAVELIPAAGLIVLCARWWATNLERLTTTVESGPPVPSRKAHPATGEHPRTPLFPRVASFLPRDRRGAVAAKDLLYLWRDPAQRAQRLTTFVLTVGGLIAVGLYQPAHQPRFTLVSPLLLWWVSLMAMGQFGIDRTAYWMNVVAAGDPVDDLVGKNLAIALLNVPIFVVLAVVLAAMTGGWVYLPAAVATGLGALGVALGVGNVTSVRLALPLPESTTNLWAQRTGQGCGTGLVMVIVLLLSQVLVAPIASVVVLALAIWTPLLTIAAPLSIGYGLLVYFVGLRIATAWLRKHQAELLEALSPRNA